MIDYGIACLFQANDGTHLTEDTTTNERGTIEFASASNLLGFSQSRRDDLESLGYTLAYLFKRQLPWYRPKSIISRKKLGSVEERKGEEVAENYDEDYEEESEVFTNEEKEKLIANKLDTKISDIIDGLPRFLIYYLEYVW